jgi:hypothetical protein
MGPRIDLDGVEKRKFLTLPGLELRPLGRPTRNQSLYQLSYPGSSSTYMTQASYASRTHTTPTFDTDITP